MLRLAYFFEVSWLLVDMVSGYFQNKEIFFIGNLTLSAIVRIGVVILSLAIVARYSKLAWSSIIFLLTLCILWILISALSVDLGSEYSFSADLQFYLKLMLPVLLVAVLRVQIGRGTLTISKVNVILIFNGVVLLTNLFLGLLGVGYGSYGVLESGDLIGSRGFFYAGNEISAALVALFALTMFVNRERLKTNYYIYIFIVVPYFIASLALMTKTAILGIMIVMLYFLSNFLSISMKLKIVAFLTIVIVASYNIWAPLMDAVVNRWEFFWNLNPDIFEFISSGRVQRIDTYLNWLTNPDSSWTFIFGNGQSASIMDSSYENDFLDLTIRSGLLGLVFYGIWISWAFKIAFASPLKSNQGAKFGFYIIGMFIFISVVAGHVILSATLAPFVAMIVTSSSIYFPSNQLPTSSR